MAIMKLPQSLMFGKNPHYGRNGLFPYTAKPTQ